MSDPQKQIRPLHLSSLNSGGAFIASMRLHHELLQQGVASRYAVGHQETESKAVTNLKNNLTSFEARLYHHSYKKNLFYNQQAQRTGAIWWSDNRTWHTLPLRLRMMDADLIHLNWIGAGFLPIQMLKWLDKPIIWTMHDHWAYTGGCHVTMDCTRFEIGCGQCPQLQSDDPDDKSYHNYQLKEKAWQNLSMIVVTPSRWLGERIKASSIFRNHHVEVIPNGVNLDTFKHLPKQEARQMLNLDPSAKYIYFGAMNVSDRNKGGDLLVEALHKLAYQQDDPIHLLIAGTYSETLNLPDNFHIHSLGFINDEVLSNTVYAAADISIVPSRQENLSNTIMESLASGTPVVAFDACGNPDLIDHQKHGYLAQPFSTEDLANGMVWGLSQSNETGYLARQYVINHYNVEDIAKRYLTIYRDILVNKSD